MDLQRIVDTNIANDRNNADMKDMIEKEYHESVPIKWINDFKFETESKKYPTVYSEWMKFRKVMNW